MPSPYASETFLHQLVDKALAAGASDIHIAAGKPPGARIRGDLVYFRADAVKSEDTAAAARVIFGARSDGAQDAIATWEAGASGRLRVTLYRRRGAAALVLRPIAGKAPSLASLGVPEGAAALCDRARGLIVVTGGVRSGKTTTVASLLAHQTARFAKHVVTLEDPIEIAIEDNKGSVSQRAVGADVASFAHGIRAAYKQDADVIAIADLCEGDAALAALDAAEAGHLVIASITAGDAVRAIEELDTLTGSSPRSRARLAGSLLGVLAQKLVPKPDGSGDALSAKLFVVGDDAARAIAAGVIGSAFAGG